MRKILIVILVCLTFMEVSAQRVTANFHNTSMTEALLTIERQCKDIRINFIYNELEDFTVTQSIRNKPVYEALPNLTMKDIVDFEQQQIARKPFRYIILGNERELDMAALQKYGPVRRVSISEIFGE